MNSNMYYVPLYSIYGIELTAEVCCVVYLYDVPRLHHVFIDASLSLALCKTSLHPLETDIYLSPAPCETCAHMYIYTRDVRARSVYYYTHTEPFACTPGVPAAVASRRPGQASRDCSVSRQGRGIDQTARHDEPPSRYARAAPLPSRALGEVRGG